MGPEPSRHPMRNEMPQHEGRPHRNSGIGPVHPYLKARRKLERGLVGFADTVQQKRRSKYGNNRRNQDGYSGAAGGRKLPIEKVETKVAAGADGRTGPHQGNPDKEISCQLFRPNQWVVQGIAENDLKEGGEGHHRHRCSEKNHLGLRDFPVNPPDVISQLAHRYLTASVTFRIKSFPSFPSNSG
jgi:hypothetical protein